MRTSVRRTVSSLAGAALIATSLNLLAVEVAAIGVVPPDGKVLTVTPASGNALVRPAFLLSEPCPSGTTSYFPYLYGPGFPDAGQPMLNGPSDTALSLTAPFSFQADFTFVDTAAKAGTTLGVGSYLLQVICQDDLTNVKASFTRAVQFTSATAYVVSGSPSPSATATSSGTQSPTAAPTSTVPPTAPSSPTPSASVRPTGITSPSPTASAPVTTAPPTARPLVAGVLAVDELGSELPEVPTLEPGRSIGLLVVGLKPDEGVVVQLDGTDLNDVTADSAGVAEYEFVVPRLAAGRHTLRFVAPSATVEFAFRSAAAVPPASSGGAAADSGSTSGRPSGAVVGVTGVLPATGSDRPQAMLLLSLLLLVAGAAALWSGRPRGRHELAR